MLELACVLPENVSWDFDRYHIELLMNVGSVVLLTILLSIPWT